VVFPSALLIDLGGTLMVELPSDTRAGNAWLFDRATRRPVGVSLDDVIDRAHRIARAVVARREETHVEVPWAAAFRLIYDHFGFEFSDSIARLEQGYWDTSVRFEPIAGAREAIDRAAHLGVQLAVVSNTAYSGSVIRAALDQHGLASHLAFVVASADYAVRKPNPVLFKLAAARLGLPPESIWFVGDRLDTDIAGANLAGMTAVWLSARPPDDQSVQIRADLTVPDWPTLVQRLERLDRLRGPDVLTPGL
jgi:HAD superfamily hydrolase (TIGR01662 family)